MTTHTTGIPDSWGNRINQASAVIGLSSEEILKILKEYGIEEKPTGLEMLSDEEVTPFGELRRIFCDERNVPVAKLRMATKYFRGPKNSATTETIDPEILALQAKFGVESKWEDLSTEQLLPCYNPNRKTSPINRTLKARYGNSKIIAFYPESCNVAVEESLNYIADLEAGFDTELAVEVDGVLVELYTINTIPNQMVEEDPLFHGRALKRGRSTANRINWTSIGQEDRQLLRILCDKGDIDPSDRVGIRNLINIDSKELQETFPEAYLEFRKLKERDELPKLRLALNDVNHQRLQNPFGVNQTY